MIEQFVLSFAFSTVIEIFCLFSITVIFCDIMVLLGSSSYVYYSQLVL